MSKENISHEGKIHSDFKKKIILKINIILIPILAAFAIFLWWILVLWDLDFYIYLRLIFFLVLIPYLVIVIPVNLYMRAYINHFSYEILENIIVINHGVFTRIRSTIPITQIQNINVVTGIFDQKYKLYSIELETAGTSAVSSGSSSGNIRPEGYIPGQKFQEATKIEKKIIGVFTKLK